MQSPVLYLLLFSTLLVNAARPEQQQSIPIPPLLLTELSFTSASLFPAKMPSYELYCATFEEMTPLPSTEIPLPPLLLAMQSETMHPSVQ
jgi:hypothetical protein